MRHQDYQWQPFDPFTDKLPWEVSEAKRIRNKESQKVRDKKRESLKQATKGRAGNING